MQPIPSKGKWRSAQGRRRIRVWTAGVLGFVAAWLVWTGMSYAVSTRLYLVPSASMSPTIRPGDRVGVQINPSAGPKRGEIWVFQMPPSAGLAPSASIKRVIGLPGETIEVTAGRVLIDGKPIPEPYLPAPPSYTLAPLQLGRNEFFMLGDSRDGSHDSHVWGPLPADYLVGPASIRCWPLTRIGGL
jgi:signal peptidase I